MKVLRISLLLACLAAIGDISAMSLDAMPNTKRKMGMPAFYNKRQKQDAERPKIAIGKKYISTLSITTPSRKKIEAEPKEVVDTTTSIIHHDLHDLIDSLSHQLRISLVLSLLGSIATVGAMNLDSMPTAKRKKAMPSQDTKRQKMSQKDPYESKESSLHPKPTSVSSLVIPALTRKTTDPELQD